MANSEIQTWHLVFVHKPNGTKDVVYANTDQFKAQSMTLRFIKRFPTETFSMSHVNKHTLAISFRVLLRETFKFY